MIGKALEKSQKPIVLFLSIAGAVIGLSLLLTVTQAYVDIKTASTVENDAFSNQFLVINKEVSNFGMITQASTHFTKEELSELEQQPFINKVSPFANLQDVYLSAKISIGGRNDGSTLAYFESVPDEFLDIDTENWSWEEGEDVKIILPTFFLDSYNFGLSEALGAPKLSKSSLGLIPIKLTAKDKSRKIIKNYTAYVSGYTDRINSAIVPLDFIKHLNKTLGSGAETKSSRVILETSNNKDPRLINFLESKGYFTNKESLRATLLERLIYPIVQFVAILCFVIICMTLLIFLLYGEVLIVNSKFDIEVLALLGYKWKAISKIFNQYFVKIYAIIIACSLTIYAFAKIFINQVIFEYLEFEGLPIMSWQTIVMLFLFIGIFIGINIFNTRRHIKKIITP